MDDRLFNLRNKHSNIQILFLSRKSKFNLLPDSSIHRLGSGQSSCGIPGLLSLPHQQHCHVKVSMKRGGQNKQSEPPTTVSNNSLQIEKKKEKKRKKTEVFSAASKQAWFKEPLCTKKCLLITWFYRNSPRMTKHSVPVVCKRPQCLSEDLPKPKG